MLKVIFILALLATASTGGCSSAGTDPPACTPSLLTLSGVQSFHAWTSYSFTCDQVPNSPHPAGPCTVYINELPDAGATEFPVGTIIVKEFTRGPTASHTILAMSKVGCDYNQGGALGWEWSQLANVTGGEQVLWSGVVNPPAESYLNTGVTCNGCHVEAVKNDYVKSAPLQLGSVGTWNVPDAGSSDASISDAGADS